MEGGSKNSASADKSKGTEATREPKNCWMQREKKTRGKGRSNRLGTVHKGNQESSKRLIRRRWQER